MCLVDDETNWTYNRHIVRSKVVLKCKNPRRNAKRVVTKGHGAGLRDPA